MERENARDLRSLAEDIRRRTASWPSSMRAPRPGTDLKRERLISGPNRGEPSTNPRESN